MSESAQLFNLYCKFMYRVCHAVSRLSSRCARLKIFASPYRQCVVDQLICHVEFLTFRIANCFKKLVADLMSAMIV